MLSRLAASRSIGANASTLDDTCDGRHREGGRARLGAALAWLEGATFKHAHQALFSLYHVVSRRTRCKP
eukprot:6203132-Pleurochrysis_carterae.AAC.2